MKIILLTDQLIQSEKMFIVGGWMQSLIQILQNSPEFEIAVIGLTEEKSSIQRKNNTTYYKVNNRKQNPLKRIYDRWTYTIQNNEIIKEYIDIIKSFEPDIIHIFGVENFLCNVIPHINCKAVVHLQGLLNPYLEAWFPPGISKRSFNFYSFNLLNFLKGSGLNQQYKTFQAMAKREKKYFQFIRFVMGRTEWDKSISSILSDNIKYFHIEEALRPEFYLQNTWKVHKRESLKLISILSPSTYKGFDLILKTAHILRSKNIRFEWLVCGTSEEDIIKNTTEKILRKKYSKYNVSFLGKKPSSELIPLLLGSDIFIHPSYIENSPNSICEAQILGMPVIATNVGGVSSLIKNNETGILLPANDPYFWANSIISLSSDPTQMQYLGENAKEAASRRHSRMDILENIQLAYNEIIELHE